VVTGQLLLLCFLHRCDIYKQHRGNSFGDKKGALEILAVTLSVKAIPVWQTIKRMREMSRFTCKTDVLTDGTCQ